MMQREKYQRKLFLDGHLTDEGIACWSDALLTNTEDKLPDFLKDHVDQCLKCKMSVIELYEILAAEQEMPVSNSQLSYQQAEKILKESTGRKKLWFRIAAFIVMIIALTALLIFMFKPGKTNEKLFAQYFTPYANIITTKTQVQGDYKTRLFEAMYFYDNRAYDQAINIFNSLINDGYTNDTVLFYCAVSYLCNDNTTNSIELFNDLLNRQNQLFYQQTQWYLALTWLKENRINRTKDLLEQIISEGGFYKVKAHQLLGEIQ